MTDAEKLMQSVHESNKKKDAPKVLGVITDENIRLPSWAYGPFRKKEEMTFAKTSQWKDPLGKGWESHGIFNPSMVAEGDKLYMIYRASPVMESLDSRLGLAVYDGEKWKDYEGNPVLYPQEPYEALGVEDPKLYRANGKYYLFYEAVSLEPTPEGMMPMTEYGDPCVEMCLAVSEDLIHWERRGPIAPRELTGGMAKGCVIPRNEKGEAVKVGGKYIMYVSAVRAGSQLVGISEDMEHWTFRPQTFLNLSRYGHIEEVATASLHSGGTEIVLDVYYIDISYNQLGAQVLYNVSDPFTQKSVAAGATFSWGGLLEYRGETLFAQGWDAPREKEQLYVYAAKSKVRE